MRRSIAASLLIGFSSLALSSTAHAAAADLPTGPEWFKDPKVNAKWTEAYITEPDGTKLHADILRPANLPDDARTPVIMSAGPYFNHSGQEGPVGAVQGGGAYNPAGTAGPSERFVDFVVEAKLMQRGYTYMMVDLRGFGGSSGCLDWGGPGEQADVKSAVEWAASQPWSTGSVGLYGKSYDGVTGLIGEAVQPKGLKAIVAQEPVFSLYNYLYTNGVRFENSLATPALYDAIAVTPGVLGGDDTLNYQVGGLTDPACLATNYASQATNSDPTSDYWKARDFITATKGHSIPMILTQGFLENNTKPEGAWDLFNGLAGPKRGWFGMWDHIRGNDEAEGDDAKPAAWFDEVMRWYDHYLRDVPLADAPVDKDPPVEVQSNDALWRSEKQWPPDDSVMYESKLKPGTYTDATNAGSAEGGVGNIAGNGTVGEGVWTISPPLAHDAQYSGVPHATVDVSAAAPGATVSVDTYDIDKTGMAILLSRSASTVNNGKLDLDLYGNDWGIPAGHRIGVRVGSADAEWWLPVGTQQPVTVAGGTIRLPFLKYTRPDKFKGKKATRLATWLAAAPFQVPDATLNAALDPTFGLPPARVARPAAPIVNPTVRPTRKPRLKLRIGAFKNPRRIVVYGNAPSGAKLVVHLVRKGRTVATKRATAKLNAFRVTFKVKRGGSYVARVSATKGKLKLKGSTARKKLT